MKVILLAGGKGKRLWPYSSKETPKQFFKLFDDKSFFQKTYLRFKKCKFVDEIIVLTNEKYRNLVNVQIDAIDSISAKHIIAEPSEKNTAPAILLGVKYIQEKLRADKNTLILVSPCDHYISPESRFLCCLKKLIKEDFSKKIKKIITFGIKPTKPETGYGYIKVDKREDGIFLKPKNFIEKPSNDVAKRYLSSDEYFWNMGIFLFSLETSLLEFKKHMEDLYKVS